MEGAGDQRVARGSCPHHTNRVPTRRRGLHSSINRYSFRQSVNGAIGGPAFPPAAVMGTARRLPAKCRIPLADVDRYVDHVNLRSYRSPSEQARRSPR